MNNGWLYRAASITGTLVLSVLAVTIANHPIVQRLFSLLPLIGDLPFDSAAGSEFVIEASLAAVVIAGALWPLYKPRPRRVLDIWLSALRRVTVALLALATIGYADLTYRLPRATLLVTGALLLVAIPAWFTLIRRRPHPSGDRMIIIGDDPETMEDILMAIDGEVLGYVSPFSAYFGDQSLQVAAPELADGGEPASLDELVCLGGLSRLDEVLVQYDVGTAVLAFARPDRAEFFGALDSCYEHGVAAKAHRDHADVVLTSGAVKRDLVDIDLEPWDWQDHAIKRLFDIMFSGIALLALSPLMLIIAVAIKIDSPGPVLYQQTRTASFGDTFMISKFRSMIPEAEAKTGAKLSAEDNGDVDPRVTRVGWFLRRTHFDEIPQLLAILRGEMSVVGPRPERPELDIEMEDGTGLWRRRWFVKPGLTGLAQINHATGFDPEEKLRYDVVYIRNQSFWFDLKIVIRQIWLVGADVVETVRGRD
jgi:lipopolysaccharide/colanic/teichoic acid biosynthesis glycosyltransferase